MILEPQPDGAAGIANLHAQKDPAPHHREMTATFLDLDNCFTLFLGRKADHDSITAAISRTISSVLSDIFELEEFQSAVLRPALLRETLPQDSLYETPPLLLVDWAQRNLPIEISTSVTIGAAQTWAQLLELLLADATLISISPSLKQAEIDSIFRTRLEKETLTKVSRAVIGAVDAASAFEVRGWAVNLCDKAVPIILEFYADGYFIGSIPCKESRADVGDVVGGTGNFGFTFKISPAHRAGFAGGRSLTVIESVSRQQIGVTIAVHADAAKSWDVIEQTHIELLEIRKVLDRIQERLPELGRKASIPIEAYNEYWQRFYRPSPEVLFAQRVRSAEFAYRPKISLIIPTWNSDTRLLHKAIESVRAQTYDRWELIITDDNSDRDELRLLWRRYATEPRIKCVESTMRGGISMNTNRGIDAADGDYIAFLDHDDELAPDALYEVVRRLQEQQYGLIYSDEDRIEEDTFGLCIHHTPFFKPDFDPDLLMALNYICHLVVLRSDVVQGLGGLRGGYEGAQDHDLLLRVVDALSPRDILHIPRVLYHWRVTPGSVSRDPRLVDEIKANIVAIVEDHLKRRNASARVEAHNDPVARGRTFANRVRWLLPPNAPLVSILIASRDRVDLLRPCIDSVLNSLVHYPGDCEIVIVDNDSTEPSTLAYFQALSAYPQVRIIGFRGPFNYSAINNHAAREAKGSVLIFLNNDTVVLTQDWCVELVANALRPEVGAVGARLLYADGTIQHAGVVLGVEGVAGHECVGETPEAGGYFGRSQLLRGAAAVTAACMATRRSLFLEMDGGFDELCLKIAFNDVDYCMKVRKAGYRVVYNPFAVLYHLESKSRGRELTQAQKTRHHNEALAFRARWSDAEMADPYYNAHFERYSRPFETAPSSAWQLPSEWKHVCGNFRERSACRTAY